MDQPIVKKGLRQAWLDSIIRHPWIIIFRAIVKSGVQSIKQHLDPVALV